MATKTTRTLGPKCRYDRLAIAANGPDYNLPYAAPKSGVLVVTVNSISWSADLAGGATDYGSVDIRSPLFNSENDSPVLDKYTLTTNTGSHTVNKKHVTAVNWGQPGPSAFLSPDGTMELLHLVYKLPDGSTNITNATVTVDYTLAFTELTPATTGGYSPSLEVAPDHPADYLQIYTGSFTGQGYVKLTVVKAVSTVYDHPTQPFLLPQDSGDPEFGDGVPDFMLGNTPTFGGFGRALDLVRHPVSKSSSGEVTYQHPGRFFVFAVNDGKIDANGYRPLQTGEGSTQEATWFGLGHATLAAPADCNDKVTLAPQVVVANVTV